MTVNPQPTVPAEWVSDREDLTDLVKDLKPFSGGDDYAIPGFFASDEEQQEFVTWVREERDKELV